MALLDRRMLASLRHELEVDRARPGALGYKGRDRRLLSRPPEPAPSAPPWRSRALRARRTFWQTPLRTPPRHSRRSGRRRLRPAASPSELDLQRPRAPRPSECTARRCASPAAARSGKPGRPRPRSVPTCRRRSGHNGPQKVLSRLMDFLCRHTRRHCLRAPFQQFGRGKWS